MSADLDDPIHTARVAGAQMRFFRAPHDALPYASLEDIFVAANIAKARRQKFREFVLSAHHSDELTSEDEVAWAKPFTVTTPNGTELVLSQVAACGLLASLITSGAISQTFAAEYRSACEGALDAMYGGAAPAALVTRLRTVVLIMHDSGKARPS